MAPSATESVPHNSGDSAQAYWEKQKPIFEPRRKLKVVCVGAGASGLLVAYKLQRHFDDFELEVFEKNPEISGTWYENRYPGCACDVPSHCYTWSFEPKTDWSASYATSQEIYQYFNDFVAKYKLAKYIKTEHQVVNAEWREESALWEVEVKNLQTNEVVRTSCHFLINAGGILNAWRYPPIPGLQDKYKGTIVHSAAWPQDLDIKDKVVGLIGNGSSGIQILPNTAPHVKELVTFIREPTWVSPPVGQGYHKYSDEEKSQFVTDPKFHLETRKKIEANMNNSFSVFQAGSIAQQHARKHMLGEMQRKLQNEKLEKLLIPEWSVGCRRITPGPNYLESLNRENVKVVYGEITSISEKGPIMDDGSEHEVEILICATGFDTTFKPRFPVVGTSGEKLSDRWSKEPKSYLGIAAADYPNYFMTLGPNCPIGNGPVLVAVEAEVEYIIKVLSKFQKENIRSIDVRPEPVEELSRWKDEFMSNTIWTEECRSWYKAGSAEGKVAALWPGSTLHYLEAMKDVRWEDWDIKYKEGSNRWAFLGNGHSSAEKRNGDLSYYIRNQDDTPIDPCLKSSSWREPVKSDDDLPRGIIPNRQDIGLESTSTHTRSDGVEEVKHVDVVA